MEKEETTLVLGLMGDVMIGRLVDEMVAKEPPSYLWGNTLPILKQTDFNLINLETTLTQSNKATPKVFNFKAAPDRVEVLKAGHIHATNIANNHILDFSSEGMLETLGVLDAAGIPHTGAGKTLAEAKHPIILEKNGIKVGIIGCTDNEPGWLATDDAPGINYLEVGDIGAVKKEIADLRKTVDLLILSIHWGPNMREAPPKHFRDFARQLIDHGVDILHGHSAHIFQGVEVYKGKPIFYDTGDFIDDYMVDPRLRNDRSFLFLVTVDKSGPCSIELIPTKIANFQVNIATGVDKKQTLDRMTKLSQEFKTKFTRSERETLTLDL